MEYESMITEAYLLSHDDILYNKDKFDSGEINLCFITGHSGSGKSTLGRNLQSDIVEHYELDDLQCTKDHFTIAQLKQYGGMMYGFFTGPGKKYYIGRAELKDTLPEDYEDVLFKAFISYAKTYAKSHKNKKYIVEGIWLLAKTSKNQPMFRPNDFKDYAVYIKNTSMLTSMLRAFKRDIKMIGVKEVIRTHNMKRYLSDERQLIKFVTYFSNLIVRQNK